MVFSDGNVYQNTFQDPNSKMLLFKLPKAKKYYGYSDDKGVLYFIDSKLERSTRKYHKAFGSKTILMDTQYGHNQSEEK